MKYSETVRTQGQGEGEKGRVILSRDSAQNKNRIIKLAHKITLDKLVSLILSFSLSFYLFISLSLSLFLSLPLSLSLSLSLPIFFSPFL